LAVGIELGHRRNERAHRYLRILKRGVCQLLEPLADDVIDSDVHIDQLSDRFAEWKPRNCIAAV
jgi:hypothetical protein